MNEYRVQNTGRVVTEQTLRTDVFPELMLPETIDEATMEYLGLDLVYYAPAPSVEVGFTAVRKGVEQDAQGRWVYAYVSEPLPPSIRKVPDFITMRQFKLGLVGTGNYQMAVEAIAGLEEPNKTLTKIEWDSAVTVSKDSILVSLLVDVLHFSEEEVDNLLINSQSN